MKKFCESLRDHAMKIIILKNEVIIKKAEGIIWKCKNLLYLLEKIENEYHCHCTAKYRDAAHSICI